MIFSAMTVKENIETGLVASGEKEVPGDLYELFPVLLEMKDRRGGNLSGGQQQQLAIGPARSRPRPKVLLLDEPTEGSSPRSSRRCADAETDSRRTRLFDRGLRAVLSFALDIADRVLVIENGEIVRDDPRAGIEPRRSRNICPSEQ